MVDMSDASMEATDPRVLRSRRMLLDALAKLLSEKEFEDISVQEIADAATLNRATFYLHYPDKNALLQALADCRFRELIARRGLSFTNCDGAIRAIALGVCDYLSELTGCPRSDSEKGPRIPLEGSIVPVVEGMFLEGMTHHTLKPGVDGSLLATTAAWAIFGAARRWSETRDRIPAEEMAVKIEAMVKPILMSGGE